MIPCMTLQCYCRYDLLVRLLQSLDYPINLLIIVLTNPSREHATKGLETIRLLELPDVDLLEVDHKPDAGAAETFNALVHRVPVDYWLAVGDDIQFAPGDLAKIDIFLRSPELGMSADYVTTHVGFACWILTALGHRRLGDFDENFYPLYYEDTDYDRRASLAGARTPIIPGLNLTHGEPGRSSSCTIHSDPKILAAHQPTFQLNRAYYTDKWGGDKGAEKYSTPFGQNHPLDYWPKPTAEARELRRWKL